MKGAKGEKMENILLTGLGISYPQNNKMDYKDLQEFYANKNVRIKSIMKILGKEQRFSMSLDDDYFSFLEKAALEAIYSSNTKIEDIDMIVVATDTPEYLSPSNAIRLANRLNMENVQVAYDLNANCASGVVAIDQVSSYLKSNIYINTALVVLAFMGSYIYMPENPISYSTFSDSAAAVVLEKEYGDIGTGIIDVCYKTDCSYNSMDVVPNNGFFNIFLNNERGDQDLKLGMNDDVDLSFIPDMWANQMNDFLRKNGLCPKDISQYLFSQFSLYHIKSTLKKLNVEDSHYTYIGNMYGYNGCCSPLFALYNACRMRKLKKNDLFILCGIGAGYTSAGLLYKVGKDDLNCGKY